MIITHRCPITNKSKELYQSTLQNYSPKTMETIWKCQRCSTLVTIKSDIYKRNNIRRTRLQTGFVPRTQHTEETK